MSDSVGKYQIEEVLSGGGSATTYRAFEPQLDRHVLLKVLHPSLAKDEKNVERFSREARAVARIRHAGIVHVYDYGKADGLYYIAMEYVEGLSLAELLAKRQRLPIGVSCFVVQSCARSLQYAHSQGVVHRDIKPGNIILGRDGTVRVTDFGLAYSENLSSITVDGELFGTPSYMSPEQIRGEKVDARTDIYSLGLTLYEILSGIQPFKGTNYSAIITKKLTEELPPLKRVMPDCPSALASVVTRMIDRSPQKRYQSMEEVALDLSRFSEESGVSVEEKELAEYLAGDERAELMPVTAVKPRTRRFVPLYLAGTIVAVAALVVFAVRMRPEKPPLPQYGTVPESIAVVEPPGSETGAVHVSSLPEGAGILVDGIPSQLKTPALITGLAPGDHELTVAVPGYRALTETVSVTAGSTSQAVLSLLPIAGTGLVRVNATPWAAVYIDGDSIDVTPFSRLLRLERGSHEIVLCNPDFPDYVANIDVAVGQTTDVSVDLSRTWSARVPQRGAGFARVNVEPWAVVYVDGDSVDTTPFNRLLRLSHGKHKLVLSNPVYPDCVKQIDIVEGETTSVFVDIRNEFGYLMLKVEPWADVYVDGEYRETTPLSGPVPIPPGEHSVKLVGPESSGWEKKFNFERGKTIEEKVVMPRG
jgi:tRNA A-37 threonylcarbamoyl transferase component Bud32